MKLIHLYSRNNSGDGLLVDLSVKTIKLAIPDDEISQVVALDPESFPEFKRRIGIDVVDKNGILKIISAIKIALFLIGFRLFSPLKIDDKKDVFFAVGGGYMRSKTTKESLKFIFAHLWQLKFSVSNKNLTSIYLPQSIGPFTGIVGLYSRHLLKKVDLIFLRDDISYNLIKTANPNTYRMPDLAVQELAENISDRRRELNVDKVFVIARKVDLGHSEEYEIKLKQLLQKIGNFELIVQSSGRGNNDSDFYEELGFQGPFRKVADALSEECGVVVSVRLHGAVQSLISGCPTIHLSYERKGFGAYEDLNIEEYVHNYYNFEVDSVLHQIEKLKYKSDSYWIKISQSAVEIINKRKFMIDLIRVKLRGVS